ncbi:MAG: RNA-binding transcriptional accessory protein [Ruminococcaceae bacterium]|nr:RNA-binding transcriptional accessory protein [Oscillospiraceae bacterium]
MDIIKTLTEEFGLKQWQVEHTIELIDDGNTIPFIARYRKEATGSLDDQLLRELSDRLTYLRNLDETREKIRAAILEQDKLTDELSAALDAAATLTELDDLYRPYKKKRKTRASVAKEKGLEPLAEAIYAQAPDSAEPLSLAADFINEELGVETAEDALAGAMDIIAELISDDADVRKRMRFVCMAHGSLVVTGAKEELDVYEMYADYREPLSKIPGHRVLAINRGEKEEFLKVSVDFDRQKAMFIIGKTHIKEGSPCTETVRAAAEDAYTRLIFPSIEREMRNELTDKASDSAIKVFSTNLKQLLMQPPVRGCVTLGLDPGYRTGCKVAVVDGTGKVLDTGVIYPVPPHKKEEEAKLIIKTLVKKHNVRIFAIGNGTASHETEVFAAEVIKELNDGISYMVVSEAGASVYSASKLAAEEFPDYDVSLRSAVSIARRLQDPLAELVKIDPKAIGVGQYQHDMPQNQLSGALDGVVESCVNSVGVDLNTASAPLLTRVSGLSSAVAKNIVLYREENGVFESRTQLKKVSKLGPKAYEQCAGFLRIAGGKNPLDNTGVHPESYPAAEKLLTLCGYDIKKIGNNGIQGLSELVEEKGKDALAEELGIGIPTLCDIVKELEKPGRDPRDELPPPMLRTDIMSMEDLKPGMELTGTVRNVIDFGAFIDIGVHQDGLVHISQITNRYIKHPSEVLKVGDIVKVWVLGVEVSKKRISLTMRKEKVSNEA